MLLEEFRDLMDDQSLTPEQCDSVAPIYVLLDFDKSDFCKLVMVLGIEKWMEKAGRWKRLARADQEFASKERYLANKARLADLAAERAVLLEAVAAYERLVEAICD